ncbi:MAG: GNAT family protein [Alphaproteobacteria bacterium]|mgnify:CR=1 FL=1|jgi:ribosomal-protein-alanine N-acetyltransferase|nr:GNAT family protein [Alphaproteobacteria bacterium]
MIHLLKILSEMMRGKPIRSGRLYLRPPHRRDVKGWLAVRAASRAFLVPWEPTWPRDALTRKAFLRRLRAHAIHSNADTGYAFYVFRAADDTLMGGITLNNVRRGVTQSCSIGYWIGEAHARQGYMTEALAGLLPFVFDTLKLHRLEAACLPSNTASQVLLRKVGFQEEGFVRHYLRINGKWHDHILFGMLDSDPRPIAVVAADPSSRYRPVPPMAPAPAHRLEIQDG